jgi:hypothetical protein
MGEWIYRSTFFLTSALVGGERSASRPCLFTPGERDPGTLRIGDLVDPRADLDDVQKRKFLTLPGLKLRPLGRRVHSQSLYRLRYPGSNNSIQFNIFYYLCAESTATRPVNNNSLLTPWDLILLKRVLSHTPGKQIFWVTNISFVMLPLHEIGRAHVWTPVTS